MRALWRLVLGNRVLPRRGDSGHLGVRAHYRLFERVRREGLNVASRMEMQALLTAHVSLSKPFSMLGPSPVKDYSTARLQDLVSARILLAPTVSRIPGFADLKDHLVTPETAPHILPVFNGLLRDAMDLMRELGQADDRRDESYYRRPSISEHPQNSRVRQLDRARGSHPRRLARHGGRGSPVGVRGRRELGYRTLSTLSAHELLLRNPFGCRPTTSSSWLAHCRRWLVAVVNRNRA